MFLKNLFTACCLLPSLLCDTLYFLAVPKNDMEQFDFRIFHFSLNDMPLYYENVMACFSYDREILRVCAYGSKLGG